MPNRLNAYLASNQQLRQLSSKAKQLNELQRHYALLVPASLQSSSQIIQLHQQVAVIAADNGAVAAKLRHMTTELISLFQARGCEITGIQIRVQVARPPVPTKPVPRRLGQNARSALKELEQTLGDSPLKAALHKLARRS